MEQEKFGKLTAYLDTLERFAPARELVIYQNHEKIYQYKSAFSDMEKTRPLTGEEMYLIYSSTKVATCIGALRLVERGLLGLEEKVSKYLPEYADLTVKEDDVLRPAKTELLVKHLFMMCGGFSYNLSSEYLKPFKQDVETSTRDVIRAWAKEPLLFDPGEGFNYSFCHDVLGGLIEVVSGKTLENYMKDEIFQPLGMKDTVFHPNEEQKKRLAIHYFYNSETKELSIGDSLNTEYHLSPNYDSGGAGIYATASDYAKLLDAIACGGTAYNGYQVLKPETVAMYARNWLDEVQRQDFPQAKDGFGYGLGCRVLVDRKPRDWECAEGIFGWGGAAGTLCIMDTKNQLSFYYSREVMGGPPCAYEEHEHNVMMNMIYQILIIR